MELKNYIIENNSRRREYYIFNSIPFFIKDFPRSSEVNVEELISSIEETLPRRYFSGVEAAYMGEFPELEEKNAVFADGAIYMTSTEDTTFDLLENIVHEVAHALEEREFTHVYSDGALEREFLGKRQRLKSILDAEGYELPEKYYLNPEYSDIFDRYLSDLVGYPLLLNLTMGLFVSPYGATSLREYFANAFENFYLEGSETVKEVSPVAYKKIVALHEEEV